MGTIYKHEMKLHVKTLLIWFACIGTMGFACILLFSSIQGEMEEVAKGFASMGGFSEAFGMNQLGFDTLTGFYAIEVGTMHGLGGAMFAAIISTSMLSKEEDGHTSEFLFTLPITRWKVVTSKWFAIITNIILFNLLCIAFYVLGFVILGEGISVREFLSYHLMQVLMQIEIASICYVISGISKKNKLGIGLGIVLLLYAYDLMARVIPALADYKFISPFSYANASDILSTGEISVVATTLGVIVLLVCLCIAFISFTKRDLAS